MTSQKFGLSMGNTGSLQPKPQAHQRNRDVLRLRTKAVSHVPRRTYSCLLCPALAALHLLQPKIVTAEFGIFYQCVTQQSCLQLLPSEELAKRQVEAAI